MSRLEKVKNIPLAVKSFLELVKDKKYSDYKLKIVGSGSQENFLKQKFGKYENISFEKFTDNPEVEYAQAKLFLITSWYEGWGMTAIESVSHGTPVVMTSVGCANEFIFNNLNGFISPNFKIKSFVETLKLALDNYSEISSPEKMQNSLNLLQTKQVYLQTLRSCWDYARK
jgi:glycosyltransferase involved in cell wall biosynthesis